MSEIRILTLPEMLVHPQPHDDMWPPSTEFVAAFEGDKLVGRIAVMGMAHLEGLWVHPEFRRTMVFYRILTTMESHLRQEGLTHIFAYSIKPEITEYMVRMGYEKRPFDVLVKEL